MNPKIVFDPNYVRTHPYRCVWASEYRMGTDYHIVREGGLEDHLLLLTLSGAGIANGTKLGTNSLYLFKPHERHDYRTAPDIGEWHFLWAHVHAPTNWLPLLDWKELSIASIPQSERRRIIALFRDVVRDSSSGSSYDVALAMNLLENMLLRLARARAIGGNLDFGDEVKSYILEHLSDCLDIATLSQMFHLSPSRFAHRFRDTFGTSPQAYVEGCRMEMARQLLLTTAMPVKAIALSCGFADPLYFSKRFACATGFSPVQWRRLCAQNIRGIDS